MQAPLQYLDEWEKLPKGDPNLTLLIYMYLNLHCVIFVCSLLSHGCISQMNSMVILLVVSALRREGAGG